MNGKCDICKKETEKAFYRGIAYPFPYYDKNKVQVLCKECYDKGMQENKEYEERNRIKVKVGDTVIRYDGLKGKVIQVYDDGTMPDVEYENGWMDILYLDTPERYYLIGRTVLGNKINENIIQEKIYCCDMDIEASKRQKKQLRKQLWRLKEEMVEDWKERRQARMNKKQNQSTEEDTED